MTDEVKSTEITGLWVIIDDPMVGNNIRVLVDCPDGYTREILVDKFPGPVVIHRSTTWVDRAPIVQPPV